MKTLKDIQNSDLKLTGTTILNGNFGPVPATRRSVVKVRSYYKGKGQFVAFAFRGEKVIARAEAEGFMGGTDARRKVERKVREQQHAAA